MRYVLPDTSLVWNFHAIGRIALLEVLDGGSPVGATSLEWSLEVRREVDRNISEAAGDLFAMFSEPVMPSPSQQINTAIIRDQIFAKVGEDRRRHMGEAEMVAIWSERAPHGSHIMCLTEDADFVRFCWQTMELSSRAHEFASGRVFVPVTTDDLLRICVKVGALDASEKSEVKRKIIGLDRPYIGPAIIYR